jgi:hypothetical protein
MMPAKRILHWVAKTDPSKTVKTDADPRRSEHVHAWFYKNGATFNQCIVPSKWILDQYNPKE